MNKFNQVYANFLKEAKSASTWSDYLKNIQHQIHTNTPIGLKGLAYGTYDFDKAEFNQEIYLPDITPLKNFINHPSNRVVLIRGKTLKPEEHYMYLGKKDDTNAPGYKNFTNEIEKINAEASRRFESLYTIIDQTKANAIKIKSNIERDVIYIQDFNNLIYAGFIDNP